MHRRMYEQKDGRMDDEWMKERRRERWVKIMPTQELLLE